MTDLQNFAARVGQDLRQYISRNAPMLCSRGSLRVGLGTGRGGGVAAQIFLHTTFDVYTSCSEKDR